MHESVIINNATIVDKSSGYVDKKMNIYIENGTIKTVSENKILKENVKTFDAEGMLVSPGFIDIHTHVYKQTNLGIDADVVGISKGVTSVFDAGSSGGKNVEHFIDTDIADNKTQIFVLLNIAKEGLIQERYEIADLDNIDEQLVCNAVEKYPNIIKGIKARASASTVGKLGIKPIEIAKKIATKVNLPLMIHIGNYPPRLSQVLDLMTEGDIVTHSYHGKKNGILSDDENIRKAKAAKDRGVLFDIGHGTSSFNFKVARKAFDMGFYPDLISTDIYKSNYEYPVVSLAVTLNKAMALGVNLQDCIQKVTTNPAKAFKLEGLGAIKPGFKGDLTIFRIEEKPVTYSDSDGNEIICNKNIDVLYTVKDGEILKLQGERI